MGLKSRDRLQLLVLGGLLVQLSACSSGSKISATNRNNLEGFSVSLQTNEVYINVENQEVGASISGTCPSNKETITLNVAQLSLAIKTLCLDGKWEILVPGDPFEEGTYSAEIVRDLTSSVAASLTIIKDVTPPQLQVTLPPVDAPIGQLTDSGSGAGDEFENSSEAQSVEFEDQAGLGCAEYSGYIIIPKASLSTAGQGDAVMLSSNATQFVKESTSVKKEVSLSDGRSYLVSEIDDEGARALYQTDQYEVVSRNCLTTLNSITPNDPFYVNQYHHQKIQSEFAWELTTGLNDVVVAVLDTGVDPNHEDFFKNGQSILVPGTNTGLCPCSLAEQMAGICSVNNGVVTYFPSGATCQDVMDTTPVVSPNPAVSSHGTWVAGVVGAVGNNEKGVAGVGWNLKVMPIRITDLNNGSAFFADIDTAVLYAAQNGAKVINASFSGGFRPSAQIVGAQARTLGGLYVNSSGNSYQNMQLDCYAMFGMGSPLCTDLAMDHPAVTIVGASNQNDQRADFSSYGVPLDINAPGVAIPTTGLNNIYQSVNGTSFSSPMVAGILGLIRSVNPALTPAQAEQVLLDSADVVLGNPLFEGRGRANAYKALLAALQPEAYFIDPANQSAFQFGGTCTELEVSKTIQLKVGDEVVGEGDCLADGTWTATANLSDTPLNDHTEVIVDHLDRAGNHSTVARRLFRRP